MRTREIGAFFGVIVVTLFATLAAVSPLAAGTPATSPEMGDTFSTKMGAAGCGDRP